MRSKKLGEIREKQPKNNYNLKRFVDEKEVARKGEMTKSIEIMQAYIFEYSSKRESQVILLSLAITKLQNHQHY